MHIHNVILYKIQTKQAYIKKKILLAHAIGLCKKDVDFRHSQTWSTNMVILGLSSLSSFSSDFLCQIRDLTLNSDPY
jgi:hypothetical protein